ncbi:MULTISPECIES: complex I NDUFA9 subunit family protein [unclassified Thioalkalivibrio]|uniref:complex I NDUFA9 subunit family protein n=1 Tax=unclassified Thioalkalivibrio TaxID=2621013 RepID=UPI000372B4F6|nr:MULTISPECIES: complex I NDUFA9 subunit family protein [unclassified Thioalkalivibrio]
MSIDSIRSVCLLGGTGFVGHQIIRRLIDRGIRVRVLSRRPHRHRDLLVNPEVDLVEGSAHDPATLERVFAGQDAVINLVGILNERGRNGSGFRAAHVELTQKALAAAESCGVRRFLQMSALKADMENPPSHYLRTKGEAEQLVFACDAFPVTVFRPSVIFGRDDSFLNRFATLLKISPFMPLARADAKFAPVYVGDVAEHFVDALEDPETFGEGFELCGPQTYSLEELVRYVGRLIGHRRPVIALPDWAGKLQASVFEFVPGKPLSRDNFASLTIDSVCEGESRLPCPTRLEAIAPEYLGGGIEARKQALRTHTREVDRG